MFSRLLLCMFAALGLSQKAFAHGTKVSVPEFGLAIDLALEQAAFADAPSVIQSIPMPLFDKAAAPVSGLNSAELSLQLTASPMPNWLILAKVGHHSHGASTDKNLVVEQGFVQGQLFKDSPQTFITLGRFYSAAGFYNQVGHSGNAYHLAPLVYQSHFGEELLDDGIRFNHHLTRHAEVGVELLSGQNNISGDRLSSGKPAVVLFMQQNLSSLLGRNEALAASNAGWSLAYLQADQQLDSTNTGHSHTADLNYQLSGKLKQLSLAGYWQINQWHLIAELIAREQTADIITSDQFLKVKDRSYGGYLWAGFDLSDNWQLSGRYDRVTYQANSYGHQALLTALELPVVQNPESLSMQLTYLPDRLQSWYVAGGSFKNTEQWYMALGYQLVFSRELF
ncbi:hypothetical protein [Oceanospirillum multiglobuliferum]|nr:hypothetical protein [Oceanospirillum multiglobuliferum]